MPLMAPQQSCSESQALRIQHPVPWSHSTEMCLPSGNGSGIVTELWRWELCIRANDLLKILGKNLTILMNKVYNGGISFIPILPWVGGEWQII